MKKKTETQKALFRRYRREGGTLDRFEVALTSLGVAALRSKAHSTTQFATLAPPRMISDSVGLFSLIDRSPDSLTES